MATQGNPVLTGWQMTFHSTLLQYKILINISCNLNYNTSVYPKSIDVDDSQIFHLSILGLISGTAGPGCQDHSAYKSWSAWC